MDKSFSEKENIALINVNKNMSKKNGKKNGLLEKLVVIIILYGQITVKELERIYLINMIVNVRNADGER